MSKLRSLIDRARQQHKIEHVRREAGYEAARKKLQEEFEHEIKTAKDKQELLMKKDLVYWEAAIENAVSVGEFYVSNKSFPQEHRHSHTYYAEALQKLFGEPFRASSSDDYTSLHWSPTKHYPSLRGN